MNGKSRSCDVELFDKKEVISSSKLCSLSFGLYKVSKYCVQSDIDYTLLVFVLRFISFKVFQKSLGLLLRVSSNCVEKINYLPELTCCDHQIRQITEGSTASGNKVEFRAGSWVCVGGGGRGCSENYHTWMRS